MNVPPSQPPTAGSSGRDQLLFVPIKDALFLTLPAPEQLALAESSGFPPLFIHQCFEQEVIADVPREAKFVFFFHEFSLHVFLKAYLNGEEYNLEDPENKKTVDRFVGRIESSIGKVIGDIETQQTVSVYQGLIMRDPTTFETAIEQWTSLPPLGTLVLTQPVPAQPNHFIEVYRAGFGARRSFFDKVIPTATMKDLHGDSFDGFHRRFEWLMHFFIESCSAISNNASWSIYTAFICHPEEMAPFQREELRQRMEGTTTNAVRLRRSSSAKPAAKPGAETPQEETQPNAGRKSAAFVSVYTYPGLGQHRKKISQFFTLPNFQRLGLASVLLGHIYDGVAEDKGVNEICVEDPALAFTQLRDFCGIEHLLRNKIISVGALFPDDYCEEKDHASEDSPEFMSRSASSLLRTADPRHIVPPSGDSLSTPPSNEPVKKVKSLFGNVVLSGALAAGASSGPSVFTEAISRRDPVESVRRLSFLQPYLEQAYDLARGHLKESEMECTRLVELLMVAKYLPKDAFFDSVRPKKRQKLDPVAPGEADVSRQSSLVDSEGARSYRHCSHITESVAKMWANDPLMEPAKLFIKMRILKQQDLDPTGGKQFTTDELIAHMMSKGMPTVLTVQAKNFINHEFLVCFYAYLRSIFKLRKIYCPGA